MRPLASHTTATPRATKLDSVASSLDASSGSTVSSALSGTPPRTLSRTTRRLGAASAVRTASALHVRRTASSPPPGASTRITRASGSASSCTPPLRGAGITGAKSVQQRERHAAPTERSRLSSRSSRASSSSQPPTTSTRPSRTAAGASIASPVQNSRSHAAALSRRRAATLTTPGSAPRRISGKPNVASVCASTTVPRQGKSIPPPRVAPWQTATVGRRACGGGRVV